MKSPTKKMPHPMKAAMTKAVAKMAAPKPGKPEAATLNATPSMGDDMKWKAQDALHTLKRAHEIKQDAGLMEHVRNHAKSERNALASIARRKT